MFFRVNYVIKFLPLTFQENKNMSESKHCKVLILGSATMVALAAWLIAPASWRVLPHPVYFTWLVSLVTFGLVALLDRRPMDRP